MCAHILEICILLLKNLHIEGKCWIRTCARMSNRVCAGLGDEHASLGDTWVDFRGLNCHSEWQSPSLGNPKRKHFVGENGHFLSVNGPSKPCRSAPWIIHPSLRPHSVFCRAFLCRSSPLPFFFPLRLNYKQVAFFFSGGQSCFQAGLLSARSPSVSPK